MYVENRTCREVEYLKALPEGLIRTGICCPGLIGGKKKVKYLRAVYGG
jgi:hypothetical protein